MVLYHQAVVAVQVEMEVHPVEVHVLHQLVLIIKYCVVMEAWEVVHLALAYYALELCQNVVIKMVIVHHRE